ncbi:hypothetical protein Z945_3663 [Sulfitobacter noctilucae]|uniref:hypothetical protein n=1 Tax=Sulfitobacter noctilucae TaxID=1342302 RepID=UPI000468D33F|nr:hypothetical protein [Sulfitobacter noctilucae]KIN70287.1 hypothetical protein Z945_3663 [Sulfitobacter noctilucae]
MAIEGLTQQQSDFVERFLKVPKVFNRKAAKERRRAAQEQFRLFNAEQDVIRAEVELLQDPDLRIELLAKLRAAEAVIERNPKALNFEGGHKLLVEVDEAQQIARLKAEAEAGIGPLEEAMERLGGGPSDPEKAQSDVTLTWTFIQEKLATEPVTLVDIQSAVKAMARLKAMIARSQTDDDNPFAVAEPTLRSVKADAEAGLEPSVLAARRILSDIHNQLAVLQEKLALQFGAEAIPLSLAMGCTLVQTKLDAGVDAPVDALAGLAEDAEAALAQVNRDADKLIALAQAWVKDHEAFQVRYAVMLAHPAGKNARFVKPEFDKIKAAYAQAKARADAHEYVQASTQIAAVRHDLKDALDFADDFANIKAVFAERRALLATLPGPNTYALPHLKDDHLAAHDLLTQATTALSAGQMTAALTALNAIPKAVEDILDQNRFAKDFKDSEKNCIAWQSHIQSSFAPQVLGMLSSENTYAARALDEARDDAAAGAHRRASGRLLALQRYLSQMATKAELITSYLDEKAAFDQRLQETQAREGAKGRIAIEGYYQALVGDQGKRDAAEASGDFKLAHAMSVRLKDQHGEMIRLADDAAAYLACKQEFDTELKKLEGVGSTDATEARATAQAMLGHAVAATQRGNWMAAATLLESAIVDIHRAVKDAETAALIDGHQGGTDGMSLTGDSDFKTVHAAFTKTHRHVAGLDKKGLFSEALVAAYDQARTVEGLMQTDLAKAEATLNAAFATCRDIAFKLSAAASFDTQLGLAETAVASAVGANAEGVVDAEVDAAQGALDAAEQAAASPEYDFAGAITLLNTAQINARRGVDTMEVYTTTIADARTRMNKAMAAYSAPDVQPYLQAQSTQIRAIRDAMDAAFDARDLREARAQAAKGEALAALQADQCTACKEAVGLLYTYVIGQAGVEQGHATTVPEMAELKTLTDGALAALQKGNFKQAHGMATDAYWVMIGARKKAESFDAFLPVRIAAADKLDALELRSVPEAGPGHDAVVALRQRFDALAELEALENYTGALKRLDGFSETCDAAAAQLDAYDHCLLQQTRAREALVAVRQLDASAIETLLVRLEGKDRNAERKMLSFAFDLAATLYAELKDECAAAQSTAASVEDYAAMTTLITEVAPDTPEDLIPLIATVRLTLRKMMREPSAMYVHAQMLDCNMLLDGAEKIAADDFYNARRDVEAAVDACVQMRLLMAQYDQLNDAAGTARGLGESLLARGAGSSIARLDVTGRISAVDLAMSAARHNHANRAQTRNDIEEAISALRDLRGIIDAHEAYMAQRAPVDTELAALEKGETRHLIRADLTQVRKHLDTAATRAADRNHRDAKAEVAAAAHCLALAKLRAEVATNKTPELGDIKAILEAPGGTAMFDDLIDSLEASVQRKVMAVAFEARFGCKLEMMKPGAGGADPQAEDQMDLPAANLRRFYLEMSKLPDSNTLDNDSMLSFEHLSGTQVGSEYQPSEKRVVMREGDEASSRIYAISVEHEIGEIDPDAVPKEGEARTAFSWNTLHEVGHAVDDKLGYMKKHGERLAGWKAYGSNVTEPAGIIAAEFEFDADYIAEYMAGSAGRDLPVPEPKGCDSDEWQRRKEACRNFVDRAREANAPWQSASVAKACAIGDYTYVESYAGSWHRYLTSARRFAVSGYQFRAPGEWFSEIYAAMASGRLNDNHPHRDEIKVLCVKEDA